MKCRQMNQRTMTLVLYYRITHQLAFTILTRMTMTLILTLGHRLSQIEVQVQDNKTSIQNVTAAAAASAAPTEAAAPVIPSISHLQNSPAVQRGMEERLRHVSGGPGGQESQGKYKSQRGGPEVVYVPRQVPWPQNYILAGPEKQRVGYDDLNIFQWVAGYAGIIRDEIDIDTKHNMIDHLIDLMEDANDFSWSGAKAAHCVVLTRLENCKIEWEDTSKLERIRRQHAQRPENKVQAISNKSLAKFSTQNSQKFTPEQLENAPICKFFNRGVCRHHEHHESGGTIYRHICATCFACKKVAYHSAKDCTELKKKSKNFQNPVLTK